MEDIGYLIHKILSSIFKTRVGNTAAADYDNKNNSDTNDKNVKGRYTVLIEAMKREQLVNEPVFMYLCVALTCLNHQNRLTSQRLKVSVISCNSRVPSSD